jgi:cytochrome c oxidase accessory protein FixG
VKAIPSRLLDAEAMYVSAPKIYPREIKGKFQKLRALAAWVLMALFYLMPWVNLWGEQAILFDLPKRQFHVLGLVFWPQDFIFLAGLLVIAALSLFFFTTLAGRLWCGYACPQTVWTEVFLALERFAEGDRGQRIKLDKAPWCWNKLRRKGLKQILWITFAAWTGVTFVGFFTPMRELVGAIWQLQLGGWEVFWICFYGIATYGNAGYLREQVCKYMCPYARFQSAMFDRDTLIISYDSARGEPRGAGKQRAGRGDCIECTLCVQVCPTGIDIRNGLQYECIACGACIDACDQVMEKVGKPLGLIRYTTENALQAKPSRILRPRIWLYGALLTLLICSVGLGLLARKPLLVDVLRDRNALYRIDSQAEIENSYTIKITNKASLARRFNITLESQANIQMRQSSASVVVEARSTYAHPVTLFAPPGQLAPQTDIRFVVRAQDQVSVERTVKSKFFAPARGIP